MGGRACGCRPCGWRARSTPPTSSPNSRWTRAASASTWWTRSSASQPEPQRRLLIETSFLDEVTRAAGRCGHRHDRVRGHARRPRARATRSSYRSMPPRRATAITSCSPRSSATCCSGSRRQAVRGLHERAAAWFEGERRPRQRRLLGRAGRRPAPGRQAAGPRRIRARVRAPAGPVRPRSARLAAATTCPRAADAGRAGRVRRGQRRDRDGFRRRRTRRHAD